MILQLCGVLLKSNEIKSHEVILRRLISRLVGARRRGCRGAVQNQVAPTCPNDAAADRGFCQFVSSMASRRRDTRDAGGGEIGANVANVAGVAGW